MDAQGADRARPYVEQAGATFQTAVDSENLLGQLYGFKAIPNGFLIDEDGVLAYKRLGGFDIRRPETAAVLDRWLAGSDLLAHTGDAEKPPGLEHDEGNALFRKGLELYQRGNVGGAMELWRQGLEHDPDNYIIRKQIWAVVAPR